MAWPLRADGPETERELHEEPFHSHVSALEVGVRPPKRTVTPRAASYAIAWWYRADGPRAGRTFQAIVCACAAATKGNTAKAAARDTGAPFTCNRRRRH